MKDTDPSGSPETRQWALGLIAFLIPVALVACGGDNGGPTTPTPTPMPTSNMALISVSLPEGNPIIAEGIAPGQFLPRGSDKIAVELSFSSSRDVPFAKLDVVLFEGAGSTSDTCGQNSPDAPTWNPFPAGQTVTVTVTGFQVSALPCIVSGIRATLHTRQGGLAASVPPPSSQILAEGLFEADFMIIAEE